MVAGTDSERPELNTELDPGSRWLRRQTLQLLFWGTWSGAIALGGIHSYGFYSGSLLISVVLGAGLWSASEILRAWALRHDWMGQAAPLLLLRTGFAILVLATLIQLLIFVVLMPAYHLGWVTMPGAGPDYRPGMVLLYWINTVIMLAVWTLAWLIIQMRVRNRRMEHQRLAAEERRRLLELDSLRARLNPHFVFNALNNLRALINEDTERARTLVTRLSNTLRYALYHSQRDQVSLEEELAVVTDYLAVEQVHYEQRLAVGQHIHVDPARVHLPPMLLQLLVENAIKHGIARTPGGGRVEIEADVDDGRLVLVVHNPGPLGETAGGVGLAYLHARLATWPGAAGFELSRQGERVRARLILPQGDTA